MRLDSIWEHNPGTLFRVKSLVIHHHRRYHSAVSRLYLYFLTRQEAVHVCDLLLAYEWSLLRRHIECQSFRCSDRRCQSVTDLVVLETVVVFKTHVKKVGKLFRLWVNLVIRVEVVCRNFVCFEVDAFQLASLALFNKDRHVVLEHFHTVHNLVVLWRVYLFIKRYSCALCGSTILGNKLIRSLLEKSWLRHEFKFAL